MQNSKNVFARHVISEPKYSFPFVLPMNYENISINTLYKYIAYKRTASGKSKDHNLREILATRNLTLGDLKDDRLYRVNVENPQVYL